ncbi:hypothetical protein BH10PSE2_BH10PSE2_27600 [soil metagenome]
MPFPIKLAFIHPIWFVALAATVFIAPALTMNGDTSSMIAVAMMSVWALLLPLGWAHGIYRGSRLVLANTNTVGPSRDWIFYIAEIGVICVPVLALGSNAVKGSGGVMEGVFGFITFALVLSYFASLWLASAALVALEEGMPKIAAHKAVGTFLLMVYWMIGAWVLSRRLKALRAALETIGTVA